MFPTVYGGKIIQVWKTGWNLHIVQKNAEQKSYKGHFLNSRVWFCYHPCCVKPPILFCFFGFMGLL